VLAHGGRRAILASGAIVRISEASIESNGIDVFVVYNGVRIAKRVGPNSPQAGTWVSLEPGIRVRAAA